MTLHVLFCPSVTVSPEGVQLPLASLALSMDDEVQYRCAGFVQSEIERYVEERDADRPARDVPSDEDSHDGSDSEPDDDAELAKAKKGKGKFPKGRKPSKDTDGIAFLRSEFKILC